MKKFLNSILSFFLAFTFIFSSAYAAFSELDFSNPFAIKTKAVSNGYFQFELAEDGKSYAIVDVDESVAGDVTIPDSYNGLPVASIASNAFGYCHLITSVTIPEGVTHIEGVAFQKCTSLITVNLPKSIEYISPKAFDYCSSLENFTIGNNLNGKGNPFIDGKGYFVVDGVLFSNQNKYITNNLLIKNINHNILEKYPSGRAEASYTIPADTMEINSEAFSSVVNLETVVVPASVTNFYMRSFRGLGEPHEKTLTIVLQHNIFPADISSNTFQNLYPGSKIIVKNDTLRKQFESKYSDIVYDFIYNSYVTIETAENPTTGLTLNSSELTLELNDRGVIVAAQAPLNTTDNLVFTSSDDSIVSFDKYDCGRFTVKGVGTALLTVSSGSVSAQCTVKVKCEHPATHLANKTEPTCTKAGYIGNTVCDTCGEVIEKGNSIEPKGHNYITVPSTDATCTKNGYTSKVYCSICGYVEAYSQPIYAKGHTPGEWIIDKEATVNKAGSKHRECTECGKILEKATIKQLKCSKPKLTQITNTSSGVKVFWSKVSGADTYKIYRKTSKSSWKYIGSTSSTSYTDKKAKSGTKYYYAIKAKNEAGDSATSNSLSIKHLADPTLKTPKSMKKGVSLKWTKTTGAQGYIIYRKTGSGSYTKLKTEKGVSNLSYVDKSAKKGKKYTYMVKAYYNSTFSAYSNAKTVKDRY